MHEIAEPTSELSTLRFGTIIFLKTVQVTTQRNTHIKHVTAITGMLHTVFCKIFTLHYRPLPPHPFAAALREACTGTGEAFLGPFPAPVENPNQYLSRVPHLTPPPNKELTHSDSRSEFQSTFPGEEKLEAVWVVCFFFFL